MYTWTLLCILLVHRCCSYVGRYLGFIGPVSIGINCKFPQIVHEIGHVVGFWHEHNRPDRDDYVNINLNNVREGFTHNFNKEPTRINSMGVTYDFNSIMHYSDNAFARTSNMKTITSKEPGIPIGVSTGLSPLDIQQTQLLYESRCSESVVWCML